MDKKTIYEYTEPMLTDGDIVEKYALAASLYNSMANAHSFIGVPATLHDALYKKNMGVGEIDIRAAIKVCHDLMMELADGLVSLLLVIRMREQYGIKPQDGVK